MTSVQHTRDRIVVGIDASQTSRHAVLWAVEEARVRRCALVITHVDPLPGEVGDAGRSAAAELEVLLAREAAAASLRQPGVPVGTLLIHGSVAEELVASSGAASLLVLGVDPDRRRADYGVLGPLEDRVVAHARCPVVAVRGRAPVEKSARRRVVVGWTDSALGRRLLEAAVAEAAIRLDALTVLVLPSSDDGELPTTGGPASLHHQIEDLATMPHKLQVSVDHAQPDDLSSVLAYGRLCDLLVMPVEQSDDPWSIRLGPWAAELIRHSPCPVMLMGRLSFSAAMAA